VLESGIFIWRLVSDVALERENQITKTEKPYLACKCM
jgi:hypothetical protein